MAPSSRSRRWPRSANNVIDDMANHPWGAEPTPYVAIGGEDAVRRLANAFYDTVETSSPRLREMLPRNTARTREKFYMYLSGWLGGPPLYEMKWGHPKLRRRHMRFGIGEYEAEEWLRCMRVAMEAEQLDERLRRYLDESFTGVARHMKNR